MPPSDYRPIEAVILAGPLWMRIRLAIKNWKLRKDPDVVEGHRVLGPK